MTTNIKKAIEKMYNNDIFDEELYFVGGTTLFNPYQKQTDFLPFVVKKCCKTLKFQTLKPLNKG